MTDGINIGMSGGGLDALAGYVVGFSETVSSSQHMDAIINFTHATLAKAFDRWMDTVARADPEAYMHVYDWPQSWGGGVKPDYVAAINEENRLWKNTLSGRGANRVASFQFLASKRPSPVDPVLTTPGPTGKAVKEGVHIFVWKAPVMEYAMHVTVTPKLSKYLAYVHREASGMGVDYGVHSIDDQRENASGITFSNGPVEFRAGGAVTTGKFTEAFLLWWSTMAEEEFNSSVLPVIQNDLIDETALGLAIRRGNTAQKTFGITAQSFKDTAMFAEGRGAAITALKAKTNKYIEMARQRRELKYGDSGWDGGEG